jgi:hypothetical protein
MAAVERSPFAQGARNEAIAIGNADAVILDFRPRQGSRRLVTKDGLKLVDGGAGATIGFEKACCVFGQSDRVENGLPQNRLADAGREPPAAGLAIEFEDWADQIRGHRRSHWLKPTGGFEI